MYVVSLGQGKIFRILPTADLDMSASGDSIPTIPLTSPETTLPPVGDETVEDNEENNNEQVSDGSDDDGDGNNNDDSENGGGGGDEEQ